MFHQFPPTKFEGATFDWQKFAFTRDAFLQERFCNVNLFTRGYHHQSKRDLYNAESIPLGKR